MTGVQTCALPISRPSGDHDIYGPGITDSARRLAGAGAGRGMGCRPCAGAHLSALIRVRKDKVTRLFEILRTGNPVPVTELQYTSPFELLVAVMLSAQATDISVNKATATLFPKTNTPAAIVKLGLSGLKRHIRHIGLFNTKARNILETCRILMHEHHGEVPSDRDALERLPGVGRKTANVLLNVAFGQPTIAVDTHIFRVANRTGLAPGRTVRAVEDELMRIVPEEFRRHAHHWLILHGRYVCTARRPRCGECTIRKHCQWQMKNQHGGHA